ncbi:hypothetical protein BFP72_18765 [Reichenbachiella sp. 5M10]|nr:hypothetical protein BFP72_18765 [Reichenbachiella sp. 5M10]
MVFRLMTWLSLDIALGAVVLTQSIAYLFGVSMEPSVSWALFLCVWMIYTLDHLLDAKKLKKEPSMPRHTFHYRFATPIFGALIVVAALSLILVFYLPVATLLYGTVVAGLVGIYILLTWWLRVFIAKEVLIATLYTVGVFLGPLSSGLVWDYSVVVVFVELWLLALINLMLFSMYEQAKDQQDGFSSWATIFGQKQLVKMLKGAFIVLFFVLLYGFWYETGRFWFIFQLLITVMGGFLAVLFFRREFFYQNESYRVIGDAVFFVPVLVFLF